MNAEPDAALAAWIDAQRPRAIAGMLLSVSPTDLIKQRPGFGQVIRPHPGAIVASPVLAAYDPDPDYFFHWYRDSAVVIDAMRLLLSESSRHAEALRHFAAFVAFSLALQAVDGRALVTSAWRSHVAADFRRFLRSDEDLAHAHGASIGGETRVNADATLDISLWGRPQHDGPALRALALLRWLRSGVLPDALSSQAGRLLQTDLAYARTYGGSPCFDIWEEQSALHYYTLRVSAAALEQGAEWLQQHQPLDSAACRAAAAELYRKLTQFWAPAAGYYRSRLLPDGEPSAKELDIAVVLGVVHAGPRPGLHGPQDGRVHATLDALERLFDSRYPINRARAVGEAPALGRYADDVYYSGGAYYFSTLGAAELCYQAAASKSSGAAGSWLARGDGFLRTVRRYTPPSGEMSEQFDQRTGEQTSAKHLSWSYAALLTCIEARRAGLQAASQSP